jgi:hypothetical protein
MYRLPEEMRPTLAKPFGRLFDSEELTKPAFGKVVRDIPVIATVGDRVTETLWRLGRAPEVQIVDGRENRMERKPPDVPYARMVRVKNPPGAITQSAIDAIREVFDGSKPARLLVDGEEDLLAIPVVVLAPLLTGVFYGQPGVGIVLIRVTMASKVRNKAILTKMKAPVLA